MTVEVRALGDPTAFGRLVGLERAARVIKSTLGAWLLESGPGDQRRGTRPRGILLFGPPGTGKTSLVTAAAEYFACSLVHAEAADVHGRREDWIIQAFAEAKEKVPSILLFDQIDRVLLRPEKGKGPVPLTQAFIGEMDSLEPCQRVVVMATANRLDLVDRALLKKGRLGCRVRVPLPRQEARERLFAVYLAGAPLHHGFDLAVAARLARGKSPAEILASVQWAKECALKRAVDGGDGRVTIADIRMALQQDVSDSTQRAQGLRGEGGGAQEG